MNDDRFTGLLGSLRTERMDRIADDRIRRKLENAWTARMERRTFGWRARRWAPVLATLVLFAGISGATMNAAGDSVLYGLRIAVEDASVALHTDPEDKAEFLLRLLDQRQAEAARLESSGNALAAAKAREIEQNTLRTVLATVPKAPEVEVVAVSPSPSPTPESTPSPTPTPTPQPTAPPATPRPATAAPTPVRTPTPTVRPTVTPVPSPILVTANGIVKNADGTPAAGVCVRLSSISQCLFTTGADGAYRVTFSGKVNQTVFFYFTRQDGTVLWKASASVTIKGPTVEVPPATLFH